MSLQRKKTGLLSPVKGQVIIEEPPEDEFEVIHLPDIPKNDPHSENDEDDSRQLPKGNMPANTFELRGSIGGYLDTMRRLQEWFETAIIVLQADLAVVVEVEDLIMARGTPRQAKTELWRSEPVGYNSQHGGLFLSFVYARLGARIWKIFGTPSVRYQVYDHDKHASPMALMKILMKSARLCGLVILQACDRRMKHSTSTRSASSRGNEHQAIMNHFRDCQRFRMPSILYDYPIRNMRRPASVPASAIGFELGTLPQQIANLYNKLVDVIRVDKSVFEPFFIQPNKVLEICTSHHPRPTVIYKGNLNIIEEAVWSRYHVEYSHVEHHFNLTSHMRLRKGGVKKGRMELGLTDKIAKELAEVYVDPSDVVEGLVKEGSEEVEDNMQRMFNKMSQQCDCNKVFHISLK